jgi:hypothetical protein
MWQPIETAPKDGTTVLLWVRGITHPVVAFWQVGGIISEDGFWLHFLLGQFDFVEVKDPTHWMPLPTPPEPR